MQALDQPEGNIDGQQAAVGQLGPGGFIVRIDRWPILGERQFGADKGHGMAVGHVMHYLAHGPAVFAVGHVELGVVQSVDGSAQAFGQQTDCLDLSSADAGQVAGRRAETADGIAKVVQICHGSNLTMLSCRMKPG